MQSEERNMLRYCAEWQGYKTTTLERQRYAEQPIQALLTDAFAG